MHLSAFYLRSCALAARVYLPTINSNRKKAVSIPSRSMILVEFDKPMADTAACKPSKCRSCGGSGPQVCWRRIQRVDGRVCRVWSSDILVRLSRKSECFWDTSTVSAWENMFDIKVVALLDTRAVSQGITCLSELFARWASFITPLDRLSKFSTLALQVDGYARYQLRHAVCESWGAWIGAEERQSATHDNP